MSYQKEAAMARCTQDKCPYGLSPEELQCGGGQCDYWQEPPAQMICPSAESCPNKAKHIEIWKDKASCNPHKYHFSCDSHYCAEGIDCDNVGACIPYVEPQPMPLCDAIGLIICPMNYKLPCKKCTDFKGCADSIRIARIVVLFGEHKEAALAAERERIRKAVEAMHLDITEEELSDNNGGSAYWKEKILYMPTNGSRQYLERIKAAILKELE
jgi:hypothetical protein